jgi:hypothetical protein
MSRCRHGKSLYPDGPRLLLPRFVAIGTWYQSEVSFEIEIRFSEKGDVPAGRTFAAPLES